MQRHGIRQGLSDIGDVFSSSSYLFLASFRLDLFSQTQAAKMKKYLGLRGSRITTAALALIVGPSYTAFGYNQGVCLPVNLI